MGGGWTLAHVLTAHCALCCLQDCSGHTADCWPRLPHPPALQRCTVLYCAVLYTVLCPPHYTLPTLHTCHKCDMLVRRELYNSIIADHLIPSPCYTDPRPLCSAQLAPAPGRAVVVRAGQLSSAATSLPCPRPGHLTPPLHRGDNVQSSIQKISIHLKLDT